MPTLPPSLDALPDWLAAAVAALRDIPALVCGDLLLDEYLYGDAERISPEAPVPVVRLTKSEIRLGGAGNVARNVASLGGAPLLAGAVGADATGDEIRALWAAEGHDTSAIIDDASRVTPRKTRILAGTQQLLRLDLEPASVQESAAWPELTDAITALLPACKVALFSDYQKGTLGPTGTPRLIAAARTAGHPILVNPKPVSAGWFLGSTLLSVNRSEALGLLSLEARLSDPIAAGPALREQLGVEQLLITRGAAGMALFQEGGSWHMPAVASEVFDVAGAGDTVLAALGLAYGAGLAAEVAMCLATYAAGVVVRKVGVATALPEEIIALAIQRPLVPVWIPDPS